MALMEQKNIFAYAVQETWKRGDALYEKYGFLVIQHATRCETQSKMLRSRKSEMWCVDISLSRSY